MFIVFVAFAQKQQTMFGDFVKEKNKPSEFAKKRFFVILHKYKISELCKIT